MVKGGSGLNFKRFLTILLVSCFVFAVALPMTGRALDEICLIAVNDTLDPLTLAYTSGTTVYVPVSIFTSYDVGVTYKYYESDGTARLYSLTSTQALYFTTTGTYDQLNNNYDLLAVYRNGTIYLPVNLVCNFFPGLSWSYIFGDDYGDVVRIKTSAVILDDWGFVNAGQSLLERYYKNLTNTQPQPSVSPTTPSLPTVGSRSMQITLGFTGLPNDTILRKLSGNGITACFYLTADQVLADPDTVRRIVCEGHSLGVNCGENVESFDETAALIYEAAMVKTLFFTCEDDDAAAIAVQEIGLSYKSYNLNVDPAYGWTYYNSLLGNFTTRCALLIPCEGADRFVTSMIQDLTGADYRVVKLIEQ